MGFGKTVIAGMAYPMVFGCVNKKFGRIFFLVGLQDSCACIGASIIDRYDL